MDIQKERKERRKDQPDFEKGRAYLVKALDHFTRYNNTDKQVFISFLGVYLGETEDYFQFTTIEYEDYTTDDKFYTNEVRHVVKGTIFTVKPLHLYLNKNIFIKVLDTPKQTI